MTRVVSAVVRMSGPLVFSGDDFRFQLITPGFSPKELHHFLDPKWSANLPQVLGPRRRARKFRGFHGDLGILRGNKKRLEGTKPFPPEPGGGGNGGLQVLTVNAARGPRWLRR